MVLEATPEQVLAMAVQAEADEPASAPADAS